MTIEIDRNSGFSAEKWGIFPVRYVSHCRLKAVEELSSPDVLLSSGRPSWTQLNKANIVLSESVIWVDFEGHRAPASASLGSSVDSVDLHIPNHPGLQTPGLEGWLTQVATSDV